MEIVETEEMQLNTRCEGQVSSTITIPHFSEDFCGRVRTKSLF